MSDNPQFKTILDLDPAAARTGAELIEVVQDGVSKKMPLSQAVPVKNVGELPDAEAIAGTELIEIVQEGESRKVALSEIIPEIPEEVPVNQLTAASAKTGAELIEVQQDGEKRKMTAAQLAAFDKYDLKVGDSAANGAIDLSAGQVFKVDNTTATAKNITLANAPAGRAATYVIEINGKAGALTWQAGIGWNGDAAPELGTTRTVVILFWNGTSFTGGQGPTR